MWRLGLILLLSAALGPLSLRAEAPIGRFVIGVWSPAGWSGAGGDYHSYDRFFTASDATHLLSQQWNPAPLALASMAEPTELAILSAAASRWRS